MALDAAGFVCPPADLVNAIISLARGKWVDAGIDFVAAVPWLGDQIKASHMAEKAGKKAIQGLEFTYKAAGNAVDAVDTLKSGLKGTLDTLDSMMGAQREFAVVGGLTMLVDDFWDAGKTLDRLDDTADLVKNARNYADGIDNFRDGSKIVNSIGDVGSVGNAADAGKAFENAADGLKATDQAKYLDDGLDMAAGADSKYLYRGKDVSPNLDVKVNVVDDAGNVVDTYSNAAKNIEGAGNNFKGTLKGAEVELPNVKTQKISYTKRNPADTSVLRNEFKSTARKDFMKDFAKQNKTKLRDMGVSEKDITKILDGKVPDGYQVHHKLPLDDGGNNNLDNLVLIKNDPYHKVIANYQNNATRNLLPGEKIDIDWPIPEDNFYNGN